MVLVFSLFVVLLATRSAESVTECYECASDGATCQSPGRTKCTQDNAATLVSMLSTSLFPNASDRSKPGGKFSCISVTHNQLMGAPGGEDTYRMAQLKGCIFASDGKLCADRAPNIGQLECQECGVDNCNGSVTLRGCMLLLVGSFVLMRLFS